MSLTEIISNDFKTCMKEQDKFSLGVLRMLKSALQMEQINKKHDLCDDEVLAVIKKQVKVRKDSILEYQKYDRKNEIEMLEKEINVLSKYLPEELSEEVVLNEIDCVFSEIQPTSMKDMGRVMKLLTERIGSQTDMSHVSFLVKERIMKGS